MKLVNVTEVAMKAGGHVAGAAVAGKLSKVKFIENITNPITRGLVMAGIGYIGVPVLTKKMKLAGGKKGGFIEALGEGIGMVGILNAAHSKFPDMIPGVAGYENNPIEGLGVLQDDDVNGLDGVDDEDVNGYEDNPIQGNDASQGDMAAAE